MNEEARAFAQPPMTGGHVDRDASTRMSESALDAAWAEAETRLISIRDGRVPVRPSHGAGPRLESEAPRGERGSEHLYLGRAEGVAYFAQDVSGHDRIDDATAQPTEWAVPFEVASDLPPVEAELVAIALALVAWHTSETRSSRDGSPTRAVQGGWARIDDQGREYFPRTDPVVIVLVEDEDRLLLGSNVLWETGRFSLLAGFVEAGESAEEAVAREVLEESSLRVSDIRYVTSQPWPFPRSFMLGFRARPAPGADTESLVPEPTELSELRWFTREELRDPPPGIVLPMPSSIARWLIDLWVEEGGE